MEDSDWQKGNEGRIVGVAISYEGRTRAAEKLAKGGNDDALANSVPAFLPLLSRL